MPSFPQRRGRQPIDLSLVGAPLVTTQAASSVGTTTATGNGTVVSDGGATITERGVVWSTSAFPTTSDSKATSAGTTGVFTASITGLSASTTYHVRAYAINGVGTSYGDDVSFATSALSTADNAALWVQLGMGPALYPAGRAA